PRDLGDGAVRLLIELTEHPSLPKLIEPLSEADQIILKTRRWLENLPASRLDLIVHGADDTMQLDAALSLTRGLAAIYRRTGNGSDRVEIKTVATAARISIFSSAGDSLQSFPLPRGTTTINF